MRNIELKARLRNWEDALRVCRELGAAAQGGITQVDTYFNVPEGRLKLREASPGRTELVYYQRPNEAGPKGCDYWLSPADAQVKPLLGVALGVLAVVRKVRTLYLWGNVRIHLDQVEGLGQFIEFEAVLDEAHGDADGHAKLGRLMEDFGLMPEDHQTHSYLEITLAG